MNEKLFVVFLLFAIAILNIIDAVWSNYAVKSGLAVELNSIANFLIVNDIFLLVKVILSILCVCFAIYIYTHDFAYLNHSLILLIPIFIFYLFAFLNIFSF
jgi:hypothetical protein